MPWNEMSLCLWKRRRDGREIASDIRRENGLSAFQELSLTIHKSLYQQRAQGSDTANDLMGDIPCLINANVTSMALL